MEINFSFGSEAVFYSLPRLIVYVFNVNPIIPIDHPRMCRDFYGTVLSLQLIVIFVYVYWTYRSVCAVRKFATVTTHALLCSVGKMHTIF